ncbi:MAG: transposase, partial [Hyphomicrobiaceae bacterium]
RDFPKTAPAFEARFKTEEDCRAYWIKARWGGKPACARCQSTRVWPLRNGTTFECAACHHQSPLLRIDQALRPGQHASRRPLHLTHYGIEQLQHIGRGFERAAEKAAVEARSSSDP